MGQCCFESDQTDPSFCLELFALGYDRKGSGADFQGCAHCTSWRHSSYAGPDFVLEYLQTTEPHPVSRARRAETEVSILPTTLLPLRYLSLPSLLSSLSTLLLVIIILVDGFMKTSAPGSITHPMDTNIWPEMTNANWLGSVGLILAGFGGHAVVPSLARDMRHPESFEKVITQSFAIAAGISFVAGTAGYLMIGNRVSDEITRDLMLPKYGYSRVLNVFALWMIVIIPLTKFGLCSRPVRSHSCTTESVGSFQLNVALENKLGISKPLSESLSGSGEHIVPQAADGYPLSPELAGPPHIFSGKSAERGAVTGSAVSRFVARAISRTIVTVLCTFTAIALPAFGKVMAFLGSFSAFLICIILPVS